MEKTAGNSSGDVRPSNKHPDPIHSVISNEDLLMEILVTLPVLSLLLFKSPHFTLRLTRKLHPPCALFLKFYSSKFYSVLLPNYDFVPLDIRIPSSSNYAFGHKASPGTLEILQSCNGLLLCHSSSCNKLFVYNPSITCMFKMIPEPPNVTFNPSSIFGGTRMAFDPNKSPHYKVIHIDTVQIYIYSSESGIWSVCGNRFLFTSFKFFQDGVYWNDAIHWVNGVNESNLHFQLDFLNEHPVITTLKTPLNLDGTDFRECKMFESCGCLLFVGKDDYDSRKLYIYGMRNGCSEWSVNYIVNLDDIMVPLPERWSMRSDVHCIVLGEREEDSFIVMKLSEKVVQYKIVSKALCTLSDLGSDNRLTSCFEFIPSFANV